MDNSEKWIVVATNRATKQREAVFGPSDIDAVNQYLRSQTNRAGWKRQYVYPKVAKSRL